MREKTADLFYAFCISSGGMCIALLYPVDIFMLAAVLILSVGFSLLCLRLDVSRRYRLPLSVGALVSASASIYIGVTLVTDFALDNSFIPICLLLAIAVAMALAFSTARASKSVASVMSALCIILLLIVLLLCIVESDFSGDMSVSADKKILFPLAVFTVLDAAYVMPLVKRKSRRMFMLGAALMPVYMIATAAVAISALSPAVYSAADTPIITMWQTCFVLSFVDRFETVIICVLFAVCAVKAGMLLKTVISTFSKKLVFLLFFLPIPLIFKPVLLYVYAAISAVSVTVYLLLKKSY